MASKVKVDTIRSLDGSSVKLPKGAVIPSGKYLSVSGNVNSTGVATITNLISTNINVTGIVTAGSFVGDGSGLTGIPATTPSKVFALSIIVS